MIREILKYSGRGELKIEIPVKASQGALLKGAPMARLSDSSGYVPFDVGAATGAEDAVGILAFDLDDKAAVQVVPLYLTGEFSKAALVAAGLDADAITSFGARMTDFVGEDLIILR